MAKTFHSYLQEDKNSSGVSFCDGNDKTGVTCALFVSAMVSQSHDGHMLF